MAVRTAEPTTVGEMLREEFLIPLNISAEQLADALELSLSEVSAVIHNKRRISDKEALLLANFLGTDLAFWANLQCAHERWAKNQQSRKAISNSL